MDKYFLKIYGITVYDNQKYLGRNVTALVKYSKMGNINDVICITEKIFCDLF